MSLLSLLLYYTKFMENQILNKNELFENWMKELKMYLISKKEFIRELIQKPQKCRLLNDSFISKIKRHLQNTSEKTQQLKNLSLTNFNHLKSLLMLPTRDLKQQFLQE